MSSEQIGKANADDQPELHRLWETVFGDPPELVQAFFDRFPPETSGWVFRHDGKICSAAYLIPGNWYINQSEMQPAAYVYAVATDPKMRGKGFGGQLMQKISAFAEERGLLLYTRPAEQSLFPWYETQMKAKNIGYIHTHHFNALSTTANLPCRRITPLEYGAAREQFLAESPHLILSESFLQLQEIYSDGYYAVGSGCCCVVKENFSLLLPELLIPNAEIKEAVQTLLMNFGAQQAIVRSIGTASDFPGIAYAGKPRPDHTNWGFFLE